MERIENLTRKLFVSTVDYKHNELGRMEHFINHEIASDQFYDPAVVDDILIKDIVKVLDAEVERIKRKMDTVVSSFTLAEREQYIQFQHLAVMQLAGNLLNYVSAEELLLPESDSTIGSCAQCTLKALDDLIHFLGMRFSSYLDNHVRLPISYKTILAHRFMSNMLAIEQDLQFKKVDAQLVGIALFPITDFINAADVAYHRVAYLNRYTEALLNLELTGENTWTDVTEMALVRLNLNTRAFHEYLERKLRSLCQANMEPEECISVLSDFLKDIQGNIEIPPISFEPFNPQVSEPISHRIDREISYLERRREMLTIVEDNTKETNTTRPAVDLSITIEELAFLVFVLREVGIIKNKNQTKLFDFFSQNFRTRLVPKASPDYFKQRYYYPESRSRETIIKLLEKMIVYIKKMPA